MVISYVSLSTRASDEEVWLYADYSETPYESAPTTVCRRDLDAILDFESHMVPEEYHMVLVIIQQTYANGCMTWFYRMPHAIMMRDTPGKPHRPTNHEIPKARDDYIKDVSAVCQRVVEIGKAGIEAKTIVVGSPQLTLV